MAPLIDSPPPTPTTSWRHHNDPPGLWAKVAAGSVLLHLLLLVSMRWFVVRVDAPTGNNAEIAIELVDEAPATAPTTEAPVEAAPADSTISDPATAPTESFTESEDAIAIAPDDITASSQNAPSDDVAPTAPIASAPNLTAQPQSDRPNALPFTPPTLSSPANPLTDTPRPPAAPVSPPPTAPPPPPNSSTASPPVTSPVTPPTSSPVAPPDSNPVQPTPPVAPANPEPQSSEATPTPPASADSGIIPTLQGVPLPEPPVPADMGEVATNPDTNPPSVPIGQAPTASNAAPAGFTANILNVSVPTDVPDIPSYPAQPKASSQEFLADAVSSACLLTPESAAYLGQSVALRITVDDQGRVVTDGTAIRQSSGSDAYDQLALCVISGWEFSPAFDRLETGDSPIYSNLDVNLTISPL